MVEPQAPAGVSLSSYSVSMANATEHERIALLGTNNGKYQALVMHTHRELAMLADIFGRRPESTRVAELLAERDRTGEEFAEDAKRWRDLRDRLRSRRKAFVDDISVTLLHGDGSLPRYQIEVPGDDAVFALPPQFNDVYNARVTPHRESQFEDALREIEEIHDEGHDLMAIYGVYGFRSRFSHNRSYGNEEKQGERDEFAQAAAMRERAGLSAFEVGRSPAGGDEPRGNDSEETGGESE